MKWRANLWLEAGLYALGVGIFGTFLFQWQIGLAVFVTIFALALVLLRPWSIGLMDSARLVDRTVSISENSAVLLVEMQSESTALEQLQQLKVSKLLENYNGRLSAPNHLTRGVLVLVVGGILGLMAEFNSSGIPAEIIDATPEIVFTPNDSSQAGEAEEVSIKALTLELTPPRYTGQERAKSSDPNLNVLEGTIVKWSVELTGQVDEFRLKSGGKEKIFAVKESNRFEGTWIAQRSGFYNFEFSQGGHRMVSDIYQIEVIKDVEPQIQVSGLDQYTRFDYVDSKGVEFTTSIKDDFIINEAHIIATVAKGSGEAVKFREEQLEFDTPFQKGSDLNLTKLIDLDAMKLTPGDELYFYVQAIDNKEPQPNITRSPTFFLSIIDTTNIEFSLEGSLGVDLMPDYFRSQRQIIIETEQLIKDKSDLTKYDFNYKSNELGFDQKALRIRYGQFMGEEFDSGIMMEDDEGNVIGEEDDPLAAYSHAHDSENEANLVEEEDEEEALLEQYKDMHEDDEDATFFTTSIKEKLRQAMTQMWDAELYLRLYQPEKSLPYQYEALRLLKQIKSHARVYVHRIGFDPPPIKEETRLTGDLDEINSQTNSESRAAADKYRNIKRSISRMAMLIESEQALSESDKALFEQAGNELAVLAIEQPGAYLNTLQQLKQLSFDNLPNEQLSPILGVAYRGLVNVLPKELSQPGLPSVEITQLKKALLSQFDKISNE